MIVTCGKCGQRLRLPDGHHVMEVHCPKCGDDFVFVARKRGAVLPGRGAASKRPLLKVAIVLAAAVLLIVVMLTGSTASPSRRPVAPDLGRPASPVVPTYQPAPPPEVARLPVAAPPAEPIAINPRPQDLPSRHPDYHPAAPLRELAVRAPTTLIAAPPPLAFKLPTVAIKLPDPLPLPRTGTTTKAFAGPAPAPLTIEAPRGNEHFYVKLQTWTTQETILAAFIRAGEKLETHVPLGDYRLVLASGSSWYGPVRRFGPKTAYSKADEKFTFYKDPDGAVGHSIWLELTVAGNLKTSDISDKEFGEEDEQPPGGDSASQPARTRGGDGP